MAEHKMSDCKNCGKPFIDEQMTGRPRKYCSDRCKKQAWKVMNEGHDPLPERKGPNGLGSCFVCKQRQAIVKVGKYEFCSECIKE